MAVDYDFLNKVEGFRTKVYSLPKMEGAKKWKSGPTFATGIDLGQMSQAEFDALPLPPDVRAKMQPMLGLMGKDAQDYVKANPFSVTPEVARAADQFINIKTVNGLKKQFPNWDSMSDQQQTVLVSLTHNFGTNGAPIAKGWIAKGDFPKAQKELRDETQWNDKTLQDRRNDEADQLSASPTFDGSTDVPEGYNGTPGVDADGFKFSDLLSSPSTIAKGVGSFLGENVAKPVKDFFGNATEKLQQGQTPAQGPLDSIGGIPLSETIETNPLGGPARVAQAAPSVAGGGIETQPLSNPRVPTYLDPNTPDFTGGPDVAAGTPPPPTSAAAPFEFNLGDVGSPDANGIPGIPGSPQRTPSDFNFENLAPPQIQPTSPGGLPFNNNDAADIFSNQRINNDAALRSVGPNAPPIWDNQSLDYDMQELLQGDIGLDPDRINALELELSTLTDTKPGMFSREGMFGPSGWAGPALQAAIGAGQVYQGMQANELARDTYDLNKGYANRNIANQAQVINTNLYDRQQGRISSAGGESGKFDSLNSYYNANKVNGSPIA